MSAQKSYLEQEIMEQPDVVRRLLESERPNVERIAEAIRQRAPRYILLAARGSSDNVARYGQYLFGAALGLPVALATPSLLTLYHRSLQLGEPALVLAISQSGQSPDIVAVIEEGARNGALTIAVTNEPTSPLARRSEHVIRLHAGQERSLAATKTYTASLTALALLCAAQTGDDERMRELEMLPGQMVGVLASSSAAVSAAERYRYMQTCVVISRGYNYATAFEIALKLKELTYVIAEPYSSADFMHGPLALVEHGFPVLAVVPEGLVASELVDFLGKLREREAELVVISALAEALALAQTPLPLPMGLPEWLSPLLSVLPGQLFALGLAQAKGYDPDHPRGLRKVTLTQ